MSGYEEELGKKGDQTAPTWTIVNALKEFFEIIALNQNIDALNQKIYVLMLVHPKKLNTENNLKGECMESQRVGIS